MIFLTLTTHCCLSIEDKPKDLPKFFDEKYLGVKRRNIQNHIKGKNALSSKSLTQIYDSISSFCENNPTLRMVANKNEFISYIRSEDLINIIKSFQSDNCYYYDQFIQLFELGMNFEEKMKKIDGQKSEKDQLKEGFRIIIETNFPHTMLNDNLIEIETLSLPFFQKTLFNFNIDVLFYLIAAWDAYFTLAFSKKINIVGPILRKLLPTYEKGNLKNTITLWLDYIQNINGFENNEEFAKAIPQLSVSPKDIDFASQKRMLHKWKTGKEKQLPSWENIYVITEMLVKHQGLDMANLGAYKAQTQLVYSHIKIFQKLLSHLMDKRCRKIHGMNDQEIVDVFERYLYWYNYHSVMMTDKRS